MLSKEKGVKFFRTIHLLGSAKLTRQSESLPLTIIIWSTVRPQWRSEGDGPPRAVIRRGWQIWGW